MRATALAAIVMLSTGVVGAQRHTAPPPPKAPAARAATPAPPFRPSGPPTILPFPPLPTQPTGGFTSGVVYPPFVHPAYSPRRSYNGAVGYGYSGGYFYAPDAQSAPAQATAEPTGLLRVAGTPTSAQVFVDGYYVATLGDIEAQRAFALPAGPHRVELRAADYVTTTFDVRISPNETVTYRAALEPARPQPPARTAPAAAGPSKMYLIPNCYLGNVPPKADRLPKGCDVKRVQVIS